MSFPCSSLTILGSAVPTIVWSREARNRASRTAPTIAAFARPSRTGAAPAASADSLKTGPLSRGPDGLSREGVNGAGDRDFTSSLRGLHVLPTVSGPAFGTQAQGR